MAGVGCFGKLGYPTRADADRAKRHIIGKRGYVKARGDVLNVYHCTKCGLHHLGRDKRAGPPRARKTADHEAGSFKSRAAKYRELTEG